MADKETKHEKFQRIVVKRMENTLIAIGRLESCGNKTAYEYTTEEALQVKETLQDAAEGVYKAYGVAGSTTATVAPTQTPAADTTPVDSQPATAIAAPVAKVAKPEGFVLPEYGGPEWQLVGEAYELLYENQGTPKEAASVKEAIAKLREAMSS